MDKYQFVRGSELQNDAYTGPDGSLSVDKDNEELRLHNGVTPGGKTIPNSEQVVLKGQVGQEQVESSTGTQTVVEALDRRGVMFKALRAPTSGTFDPEDYLETSTKIQLGAFCHTLGYYEPGDGGGNDYEVVSGGTGTADGGSFIDLDSGLQARGLFAAGVHAEQFGVTESIDASEGLNSALSFSNTVFYSTSLNCKSPVILDSSTLKQIKASAMLDFSEFSGGDAMIESQGSISGTTSIEANKGDSQISIVGLSLNQGDFIRLESSVFADSSAAGQDMLGARAQDVPFSEIVEVVSADGSDLITLDREIAYTYPSGSTVAKVDYVDSPSLRDVVINASGIVSTPLRIEFANNALIENVTIRDCASTSVIRGCFGGSKIKGITVYGDKSRRDEGINLQFFRIVDGCDNFTIDGFDLSHGGQLIDITYTPSSDFRAPCRNTVIMNGTVRDTTHSAVTSHPTQDGLVVKNVTGYGVNGAVYIRSRRAVIENIVAYSNNYSEIPGIWFGEDGHWTDSKVINCEMHNFVDGYYFTGHNSVLERRVIALVNSRSYNCGYGETWGGIESNVIPEVISIGNSHQQPVLAGIRITRNWRNAKFEDFTIDGGCSEYGISITDTMTGGSFVGRVANIATPSINFTGMPQGVIIDIDTDDSITNINNAGNERTHSLIRRLGFKTSGFTSPGTSPTTIASNVGFVWNRFGDNASIVVTVLGSVSGTSGAKLLSLYAAESSISPVINFEPSFTGTFKAEIYIVGKGTSSQYTVATLLGNGETRTFSAYRTANTAAAFLFSLNGSVDVGTDDLVVESMLAEGYF